MQPQFMIPLRFLPHQTFCAKLMKASSSVPHSQKPGQLLAPVLCHMFARKLFPSSTPSCRLLHSSQRRQAGHSKWQNIKHTKAAFDREKSIKSNLLVKNVKAVLDKNTLTDPKLNPELANLMKWARSNNITNEVINSTIDKQIKLRDPNNITVFEGRGPMNIGIVIECFSLKPHHTKSILQGLVKKVGINLNAPATNLFDYKGVVDVELPESEAAEAAANPDSFSLEKYIDTAIIVGAEEVKLENDGEKFYLEFFCGPVEVKAVHKRLQEQGLNVSSSQSTYLPKVTVPVPSDFLENIRKLSDKLDMNGDVIKYYFNVEEEESS